MAVWHRRQKTLHPVGVALKRIHALQCSSLSRERRALVAVRSAPVPTFACFAGIEELLGRLSDRTHLCSSRRSLAAGANVLSLRLRTVEPLDVVPKRGATEPQTLARLPSRAVP